MLCMHLDDDCCVFISLADLQDLETLCPIQRLSLVGSLHGEHIRMCSDQVSQHKN